MTIHIIGVPMDLGAGRRGVDMGPSAIRIAGIGVRLRELGYKVIDEGDLSIKTQEEQKVKDPHAKYLPEITRAITVLARKVQKIVQHGHFPLVLGGDHSVAIGTIAGIAAQARKKRKKVGVFWVDAHGDFNSPESSPSGNIHGMPMALTIGEDNKDCAVHKLDDETKKYWDHLKTIGKVSPKVLPEDVVFISLRDYEKEEKYIIDKYNIKVITTKEVRSKGPENVVRSVVRYLDDCTDIYVSFDVDSLDSSISKGTGTPVGNGLKEREVEDLISKFMQNRKICCFEIAEVNPTLDKENLMAEIAFNILQRSVNILMMN